MRFLIRLMRRLDIGGAVHLRSGASDGVCKRTRRRGLSAVVPIDLVGQVVRLVVDYWPEILAQRDNPGEAGRGSVNEVYRSLMTMTKPLLT